MDENVSTFNEESRCVLQKVRRLSYQEWHAEMCTHAWLAEVGLHMYSEITRLHTTARTQANMCCKHMLLP